MSQHGGRLTLRFNFGLRQHPTRWWNSQNEEMDFKRTSAHDARQRRLYMKPIHAVLCLAFVVRLLWPESSEGTTSSLTLKLYRVPENTPSQDRLYAAGTFNNWNPADPQAVFQKDDHGVFTLTLPLTTSSSLVAFKVTRGSWSTVERDEDGRDVSNHELELTAQSSTKALNIQSWADLPLPQGGTRSGRVEVRDFSMSIWGTRKIWIYLPPDYQLSTKNYPVLYMYDAQNLFDRRSAAFGHEWNVDESLEELFYEENFPGLIIVALDNSSRRGCEYNVFSEDPHPYCADGSAQGQSLNDAIVQELKPWIDRNYRSRQERVHTAIMGSSMGGQMALDMGLRYPDVFSRVLALSPSYQNQLQHPLRMPDWIRSLTIPADLAVYQDMGDAESIRELSAAALIGNMHEVQRALHDRGLGKERNEARVIPGALHHEKAWAARFKDLVRRLSSP
jgi:predicted alpha/beta superfamily hydrolase